MHRTTSSKQSLASFSGHDDSSNGEAVASSRELKMKKKLAVEGQFTRTVPSEWTIDQVCSFLEWKRVPGHIVELFRRHGIDGRMLQSLSKDELIGKPLEIELYCDIHKTWRAVQQAQSNRLFWIVMNQSNQAARALLDKEQGYAIMTCFQRLRASFSENFDDISRLLFSFSYMLFSLTITSISMAFVHNSVPDYPPLPDVLLDNIPYVPWAFNFSEVCILSMTGIFLLLLLLHTHRLVILRRFLAVLATVFLLRSLTMFVTSVSVPGAHLRHKCSFSLEDSVEAKMAYAFEIAKHLGSSLSGLQTCGDYVFSGHTSVATCLNYFIVHYSSKRARGLHTLSWVCNVLVMLAILAAHEHYSLDVFLAFYISSRLFWSYHTQPGHPMIHSGILLERRMSSYFPIFSYLEETTTELVPNEFIITTPSKLLF